MTTPIIVLVILYAIAFLLYLYTSGLGRNYYRAANKIILAGLYVAIAIVGFVQNGRNFASFEVVLLIALFFTFIGDVVLMINFKIGAGIFTIGNLLLFVYEILLLDSMNHKFSEYWWFLLIWAGVLGGYMLLEKLTSRFEISGLKTRLETFAYLGLVSLHGCVGLTMYFITDIPWCIMLGIGSALFMASDFVLCSYTYSVNHYKAVHRLNTFLYFVGIFLVALSQVGF